jgi:hypothetical protein
MKRLLLGVILLSLLSFTSVMGQTFTCTIQNQHVSGTDFIFDIYMLRTGGTDIYLGNSDFVLTFNAGNFSSPTVDVVAMGTSRLDGYGWAPDLQNGDRAILNISPPVIGSQSTFNSKIQVISNSGNGTLIATMIISGISNPAGSANLQWRRSTPNTTDINNMANSTPWAETNISGNGTYTNPSDQSLPVDMTGLTASASREQGVVVEWRVESETNCAGFHVLRSNAVDGAYQQVTAATDMIPGRGNASDAKDYRYIDRNVETGKLYWYKIVELSTDGKQKMFGPISVTAVSPVPTDFGFSQCYPNPFNPETTMDYRIAENGYVSVIVYDIMGKQIRLLVRESKPAGYYKATWNGRDDQEKAAPSGIYFIRMQSGDFSRVRKVMLMK